ncbi:Protein-tyrosine-phosphatase [Aphelenchoides besseyi]|nr:Protein-tyrosine-phosphatase [Aphelenchoides besseyi]
MPSCLFQLSIAILFQLFHSTAGYRNDGPPTLLVRPESKIVLDGDPVVFFCRALGVPQPEIIFLLNGQIIANSRYKIKTLPNGLSILRIDPVRPSDANNTISCTAENGIGSPVKAEAQLTILDKDSLPDGFPRIESQPTMKSVERGRTAHLSCRVHGDNTRILWLKNSIPIDVRANSRYSISTMGNPGALMIQKAVEDDQGRYECVASSDKGVVHSKTVHLFVKERQIPPYFSVKLPAVHKVPTGGSVNLSCTAVGFPMPKILWQSANSALDNSQIAPIGKNVLTVTDVRKAESYKCVAVSKLGSISATTLVQPEGLYVPIPALQNLRVNDVNTSAVVLKWDLLPPIDEKIAKFVVRYRPKFNDGQGTERDFYDVEQNEVTISELEAFQHYEFTVQIESSSGKRSPPTIPVEAHTAEQPHEAAPHNIQLRPLRESGSLLVEWTPPNENVHGRITGYKLIYTDLSDEAPEEDWRQKELNTRDFATTLTGLDFKRPIYVRVKALNSKGASPWSEIAKLVVNMENVPSAPRDLQVIQLNATAYQVNWSPPEFSNGQIRGYYVYQEKLVNGAPIVNGRRKAVAIVNQDAKSALISDFEPNTEYVIRVNAINELGDGDLASSDRFITGRNPPGPPRPQSVSLMDETPPLRARIEWLPAVDKGDGSTAPIQGYSISYRPVGTQITTWQTVEVNGDEKSAVMPNLLMGTEYEIQMAAFNDDGRSENVSERLNTPVGRPSGTPQSVRYTINGDKLTLQWDPPAASKTNGPIIAYHPVLACSDNTPPQHHNVSRTWDIYSIDLQKQYSFRVAAKTAKGDGPFSESVLITPLNSRIKDSWKQFEKYYNNMCSYTGALVGPPTNVTIQALTNDSVVVQWAFDEAQNGGLADGFVVKYIHEPNREEHSVNDMDRWKPQSVMDPQARHVEINRLTAHKPYAFCVLAIKNSRLGPCSDPPTTIDRIYPTHVVQNLHVQYKTSQSVALHWDFDSSMNPNENLGFYINQSGTKNYRTQFLKDEHLSAPGFERRISISERNFLWSNLRPYMNYTFRVGVYSLNDQKTFWPREIMIRTDPTGPPLVDTPEFTESRSYGTADLRLKCATEEHGPISHYWIVVIPGNFSKEDVMNVDSQQLIQSTHRWRLRSDMTPRISPVDSKATKRRALAGGNKVENGEMIDLHVYANGHSVRLDENEDDEATTDEEGGDDEQRKEHSSRLRLKRKADFDDENELEIVHRKRSRRTLDNGRRKRKRRHGERKTREPAPPLITRSLDGVYIGAQLSSQQLERMYRNEELFTLGDGKEYGGYLNLPLDPKQQYRVMSRAFASDQSSSRFDRPFEYRAPMQEPASKLFTDSLVSDPFTSKPVLMTHATQRIGNMNIIIPVVFFFILSTIIGMLVTWWLKCNRKGASTGAFGHHNGGTMSRRHGSITKIALGTDFAQINGNGNGIYGPASARTLPNETSKLLMNGGTGITSNGTLGHRSQNGDLNGHAHFARNSAPNTDPPLYDLYPSNGGLSISQNNLHDGGIVNGGMVGNDQLFSTSTALTLAGSGSVGHIGHHTAIPLSEFRAHVERLKMNNNEQFIKEFESIETDQHGISWEHSKLDVNKPKNRYANVVAYDHTRVTLQPVSRSATGGPIGPLNGRMDDEDEDEEEPGSDYINANYIDGWTKQRAYIATQGPLPETFADFWRMVWEERSAVVVMLTRLEERSRVKCSQYWPSRNSATYGHIVVTVTSTTELAHYTIRTMRLEHLIEQEVREIKHTQYTSWPDHGVPDHPTPFLMFLKKVKALNPAGAGPIVTHCSAGVGRTGAFIVVDCMLERIQSENTVDIYGCVKTLRSQRTYMVQTDEQYIFIHDAVLDAAQSGSTEVPANKLKQHIETNIHAIIPGIQGNTTNLDVEFQSLLALHPPNVTFYAAQQPVNGAKNRSQNQLPYDSNRVMLQRHMNAEGSDYINASWIDSYQRRRAYIATQAPMSNTVVDFWRMLWETDSCVVVMLTGQPQFSQRGGASVAFEQSERYAEYWPANGAMRYDSIIVEIIQESRIDDYIIHELKIKNTLENQSRTIRHFQFLNWSDRGDAAVDPLELNTFIGTIHHAHQTFGLDGPICVHCTNGAGRTGVFIAIANIIERISLEKVVDVFTTVKLLRAQRPNMVETKAELELVYDAALAYYNSVSKEKDFW